MAEQLAGLDIHSVADLLEHFPFRYDDLRLRNITEVEDGEKITIKGEICGEPHVQMYGRKKSRMTCMLLVQQTHLITTVWFNRHFMRQQLRLGREIIVTGKWDERRLQLTVSQFEFSQQGGGSKQGGNSASTGGTATGGSEISGTADGAADEGAADEGAVIEGGQRNADGQQSAGRKQRYDGDASRLQPVYSLSGELTQRWLRTIIERLLKQYSGAIAETLPEQLLDKYHLISRREAIQHMHLPAEASMSKQARRRLAYEELFMFQLKLQAMRTLTRRAADGVAHRIADDEIAHFMRSLPFQLTDSQREVLREIIADLRSPYCMNRLLQGDVGSGKTVVAAAALFAVVRSGAQGALMVPTEIVAEQHTESLHQLLTPFGIKVEMLTGGMKERQRRSVLAALQSGEIDIIIGTHALIQEGVHFHRLGLVVIDEQHRFGVNQRSILRRKGINPDVLTMTATPIPRTLAMTVFGDMDVSTLRELPQGRKPIVTYWVRYNMWERTLRFAEKEMRAGRQAYVICPLIEQSEHLDVQNAIDLYEELRDFYSDISVGLLHGRQSAEEKETVMRAFSANELQMLVSTTVVEVGVNVPNASVMIVYDAERFGLSQLHQLRGRVGRGHHQSYCILIAEPQSEVGKQRMQVMTETNDGFEIAQRDLELRGPGDFFGTKQSGLPEFRIADLATDFAILEAARDDAAQLIAEPDFWTAELYLPLRQMLQREGVLQGKALN